MFHFEKLRSEAAAYRARTSPTPASFRVALMLGTAATIACPVAGADSVCDTQSAAEDAQKACLTAVSAVSAGERLEPVYVSAAVSDVDTGDAEPFNPVPQPNPKPESFETLSLPVVSSSGTGLSHSGGIQNFSSVFAGNQATLAFRGQALGPVGVERNERGIAALETQRLRDVLGPLLDDSTQLLLSQFRNGYVSIDQLKAIGITAHLDLTSGTLDMEAPNRSNLPVRPRVIRPKEERRENLLNLTASRARVVPPPPPPETDPAPALEDTGKSSDPSPAVAANRLTATFRGETLGTLTYEMRSSRVTGVEAERLQDVLGPLLDDSTELLLSQFRDGYVSIDQLRAIGILTWFDPETFTLEFDAAAKDDRLLQARFDAPIVATTPDDLLTPAAGRSPTARDMAATNRDAAPGPFISPYDPDESEAPKPVFYTWDMKPPESTSKSTEPSRMDAFRANLSKVLTTELTASFNGRALAPTPVKTTLSEIIAVEAAHLKHHLAPLLEETVSQDLSALDDGFVSVDRLAGIGIEAKLNPATLTLDLNAPAKANGPVQMSLSERGIPDGVETASPSNFAAGLTSTFLATETFDDDVDTALSSALNGFVNIGGVRGLNLDYGGVLTFDDGTGDSDYDADRTILFMDRPEKALRFEAGTLFTPLSDLSGEADFLGVGVTKSYRQLQPTRILRPLGRRSFELNRASEVTVLVDGQVVSRFDAPAGQVNLNDIPLANLSNRVEIIAEDEFGRLESESFRVTSDALLLSPGYSEYSFGVGQERDRTQSGYSYNSETLAVGSYQYGVTPGLTLGAFGHYSEDLAIVGGKSIFAVLDGIAQAEVGYSDSDTSGGGMAASFDYRWYSTPSMGPAQNFAFAVDYREESYTPAGSIFGSATKFDASAFYERQLSERWRVNVSGTYSEDYITDQTSENITLGTSYQLGRFYIGAGVRAGSYPGRDEEFGAFFTLTRRIGERSSASARYDTFNDRASLRYRRPSRNEVGSFGFESELSSREEELNLRGAVDYTANRYRSRLAVNQSGQDNQLDGDTSVSARFQTGIAIADGQFGIGRDPGRGFVMVDRHESLDDARVEIRSRGREGLAAQSGAFGPAVSLIGAPYVPQTTRIDVADAPIGYNIGEGSYYSIPGARSGIRIEVGTDAYRSATATFTADGEPLGLMPGTVTNLETGASQITFTNSAGRALFSNLEPGTYEVDFSDGDYTFTFEIDAESDAFSPLGVIDFSTETTQ